MSCTQCLVVKTRFWGRRKNFHHPVTFTPLDSETLRQSSMLVIQGTPTRTLKLICICSFPTFPFHLSRILLLLWSAAIWISNDQMQTTSQTVAASVWEFSVVENKKEIHRFYTPMQSVQFSFHQIHSSLKINSLNKYTRKQENAYSKQC